MALTMTEEREAGIRKMAAYIWRHDLGAAENALDDMLIELDATRAELARLRAEMPSEGERAALKTLRELRAHPEFGVLVSDLETSLGMVDGCCAAHERTSEVFRAALALLAPEGEVERG